MKKALAIVFAILMLAGLLAACGGASSSAAPAASGGGAAASAPAATGEVDFTENETFTIFQKQDNGQFYSNFSDAPAMAFLQEKFNTTLEFVHPPAGSELDNFSLMLGTEEYTDLISLDYLQSPLGELYTDGAIIDIVEYLNYMPNLKALLENNPGFAKNMYDDSGHILSLKMFYTEPEQIWGGLVYRRDILDTMTGGNIEFPSGEDIPTTIEDWEYMLPIYKQYFEESGMQNYAPFIIPYNGLFTYSELLNGFGASNTYYLEGDVVKYGPLQDGFYNYLSKLRDWYAQGYIYTDFASRINDPAFFPNTELTYSGATGIWYGLQSSLGDAMSMPEYDMYFDVQPMLNPLDTEHGITEAAPFARTSVDNIPARGFAVATTCANIPKLLTIIDYMYSEEAGMLLYGITKEQGADTNEVMIAAGLQDGNYWFNEDGSFEFNPLLSIAGGTLAHDEFVNTRFMFYREQKHWNESSTDIMKYADEIWGAYPDAAQKMLPVSLDLAEDAAAFSANNTAMNDFMYTEIANFIMGTSELNEESWEAFKASLIESGAEDNIAYQQAAYERYLAR